MPANGTEAEQSDFLTYRDAGGLFRRFPRAKAHLHFPNRSERRDGEGRPTLARHSTVQLTLGRYAHADLYDLAGAVDGLPSLLPEGHKPEALAATGTLGLQSPPPPDARPETGSKTPCLTPWPSTGSFWEIC